MAVKEEERKGWRRGGVGKNHLALQQSQPQIRAPVSGERLLVQILRNPISPATALGSVTCRGKVLGFCSCSQLPCSLTLPQLEGKKLNKGTVGDLGEAAPILQARGSIRNFTPHPWGFLEKEDSDISLLFTFASLNASKLHVCYQATKKGEKRTLLVISAYSMEKVGLCKCGGQTCLCAAAPGLCGAFGIPTGLYIKAVHLNIHKRVCGAEPFPNACRDPFLFPPVWSAPTSSQSNNLN